MASENAIKFPSLINLISLHKQLTIIVCFFKKLSSFMHEVENTTWRRNVELSFRERNLKPEKYVCVCCCLKIENAIKLLTARERPVQTTLTPLFLL